MLFILHVQHSEPLPPALSEDLSSPINHPLTHLMGFPEGVLGASCKGSSVISCHKDPDIIRSLLFSRIPTSPHEAMPILNIYQQVYLLSLLSNIIREKKGSVQTLQANAQQEIVPIAHHVLGWPIVWGPVVWKNDPDNKLTDPDHVWFVAKKSPQTFVISIAGSATIYNHLVHNGGVAQVVDFTTWATAPPSPTSTIVSSGTYVAFGTAQGVHTLRSYSAPAGATGAGKTLSQFLRDTPRGPQPQSIFTGFSLGGTLSPTLALALKKDTGVFQNTDEVLTYPIAGASPGNDAFAKLFADKFPKIPLTGGSGYKVWNGNVANSLDIVPQAWSTDSRQSQNLGKIPGIYGTPALAGVERKVNLAKEAASKSGIVYIPLQSTPFTNPDPVTTPKSEEEFIEIAKKQHSKAYSAYFKIKLPRRSNSLGVQAGLEGSTVEDESATVKLEGAVEVDGGEEDDSEDLFPDLILDI